MSHFPSSPDHQGFADALHKRAWRHWMGDESRDPHHIIDEGLEKDAQKEKAFQLWKEAAEIGHGDSMFWLGLCYEYGWGCEQDSNRSLFWYEKAAQKGHGNSMRRLGVCYEFGHGCEKNLDVSFYWYEKAAKRGHGRFMVKAGDWYENKKGLKKESALQLEWWELVAQQGGAALLYESGRIKIENDYSVGYTCLSIALNYGHKDALPWLLHHHQMELAPDESIAKLRSTHHRDPSDFVAAFLLAECLSDSFKLNDLDEAMALLAEIPKDVPFYARSQWLVPFLKEKKNAIFLSAHSAQSFPNKSDFVDHYDLQIVALIGRGQFGNVYLERYKQSWDDKGRWVAVKYLNNNEFEEHKDAVNKLMCERLTNQIVKVSNAQNVVDYIGIVTDFGNQRSGLVFEVCADLSLVIEDAENQILSRAYRELIGDYSNDVLPDWTDRVPSSLRSAVVFARACIFTMAQLIRIFCDVAKAIQCLHYLGILHRDISDRNVLCDGNGTVQLADFGMSRFVGVGTDFDDQTMLEYSHRLTEGNQYAVAWWPPECLGEEPIFSFASDVYSFFVMVWQCLACEDPFQSLLEGDGDPFVRVTEAILSGQRPDLSKLRSDTPVRLRNLLEDSWAADPLSRPTLTEVISELGEISEELNQTPANRRVSRRRRANQIAGHWFDVKNMYLEKPNAELVRIAQSCSNGSFGATFLQRQVTERLERAPSMIALSEQTIRLLGGRRPYDVFIVHTGEQKFTEASSLKRTLELFGYRCFLDRKMKNRDGRPVDQMGFALATCRYVVAIVSKVFLTKNFPCKELQNALDRAQWLESPSLFGLPFKSWRLLHVVLLDLSVNEYATAQADMRRPSKDLPSLPALGREVVMKEYGNGQGKIEDWPTLSEELGAELLSQDKEHGAVDSWNTFLQGWDSLSERGFPRADTVYYD